MAASLLEGNARIHLDISRERHRGVAILASNRTSHGISLAGLAAVLPDQSNLAGICDRHALLWAPRLGCVSISSGHSAFAEASRRQVPEVRLRPRRTPLTRSNDNVPRMRHPLVANRAGLSPIQVPRGHQETDSGYFAPAGQAVVVEARSPLALAAARSSSPRAPGSFPVLGEIRVMRQVP